VTNPRPPVPATIQAIVLALPVAAILAGGLQTVRATWREYERSHQHHVDVARQMNRVMAQVDDVLPPKGRIGYIDPHYSPSSPRAIRQFYLTQYALAPRVIVHDTTLDYVIYFSHQEVPLTSDAIPAGMRVLRHVRNDLAVLTRAR
jgi:hypothetical protein